MSAEFSLNPITDPALSAFHTPGPSLAEWLSIWRDVAFTYQTDAAGRIISVSSSVQEVLGYDPEELRGTDLNSLRSDHDPSANGLAKADGLGGLAAPPSLLAIRRANGTTAYLDLRERLLVDQHGRNIGREGLAYDLTTYILSRQSLQRSENRYRRLVERLSGDYTFYTSTPDGIVTYASPSVKKILGYEPEDIVGHNWRELIGENFVGRDRADQVRDEVDAGIDFHKFCIEVAHADGSRRLLEIQQRPNFDEQGVYVSMEGIAKDITEPTRNALELERLKDELEERVQRRTAELVTSNKRLAESEARYRTVIEDQTEFICRWRPQGTFTFVNDAYARYRNSSSEQIVGTSFFANLDPEDRPQVEAEIARLRPENPSLSSEHRIISADGTLRWNHWTIRALFDKHGQCFEYQAVGQDVTDLRLAEERVQEREEHLKRVSRLVTIGELISGIAHEIHQPLHAAQLFAEAARRNLETEPADVDTAIDCTREVTAAIIRTASIIRHLRSFTTSRSSAAEVLDLNEVLDEVNEILSFEIRRAGVQVQFQKEENLPLVRADRVQLQQIFVNFYRNAIEAMNGLPLDQRRLAVTTRWADEMLEVQVTDRGIGSQEADLDRLFDAFYSTKPGGLGMGLSICRTIAESHQGQLQAWNNSEGGMTFSLRLPPSRRNDS